MDNIKKGKKVYVSDASSRHHGRVGEVTYEFSNGTHVNVQLDGDVGPRYLRKAELALVPAVGDRVRLKAQPVIHGTVQDVGHGGLNLKIYWDRFQDCTFAGQSAWGYAPDSLEPADEPALAVGDRVRLTMATGGSALNGATGKISEINPVYDGAGIIVLWDKADHVHLLLRGGSTWESPTSLTKIEAEPAIEVPTPAPTLDETVAKIREKFNEQVKALNEQPMTVDPFWRAAAKALQQVAGKRTYFTTDDVWGKLKRSTPEGFTIDPRAMGALMIQAEKLGLVQPTKRSKASKRKECHRRPIRVWKVTELGKRGAATLAQPQS